MCWPPAAVLSVSEWAGSSSELGITGDEASSRSLFPTAQLSVLRMPLRILLLIKSIGWKGNSGALSSMIFHQTGGNLGLILGSKHLINLSALFICSCLFSILCYSGTCALVEFPQHLYPAGFLLLAETSLGFI